MSRMLKAALAAGAVLVSADAASAQSLTRIEPHGFYGATISIEEGVRVFRALPPTSHMIINPGGKTPVNITLMDGGGQQAAGPVGGDEPAPPPYFANGGGQVVGGFYGGYGRGFSMASGSGTSVKPYPSPVGRPVGRPGRGHR